VNISEAKLVRSTLCLEYMISKLTAYTLVPKIIWGKMVAIKAPAGAQLYMSAVALVLRLKVLSGHGFSCLQAAGVHTSINSVITKEKLWV